MFRRRYIRVGDVKVRMDPETGLPEVPPGYEWQVVRNQGMLAGSFPLTVQLVDDRGRACGSGRSALPTSASTARSAAHIYVREFVAPDDIDRLVGTYPPKTLR